MRVELTVTAGPHAGRAFAFDRHDTFLVGRSKDAHLQLSYDDPYFSRRHFLVEINPPRVRVIDLNSRNGVRVNGDRVTSAELKDGDELRAGHTVFKVLVPPDDPDEQATIDLPAAAGPPLTAVQHGPPDPLGDLGTIPGYRFRAELGRGGMGVVYRAERVSDGRPAAVKTITPSPAATGKDVDRFLREARILGGLKHPNVVGFQDAGDAGGTLYIAMDLVDGPDAGKLVKEKGPLPVRAAVRVAVQALDGLAHAHAAGFVHRDVKPSNLLVGAGPDGKRAVKVADFGLARAFEESRMSGLTMQGEVGGTPVFMAPDQVTHYRDAKPAADQYSLAATLYWLLTGAYTHDFPRNVEGQLIALMTEKPVPIRDRRADVPAGLAAAVHRGLSREPGDRFPDAKAFRDALRPFAG